MDSRVALRLGSGAALLLTAAALVEGPQRPQSVFEARYADLVTEDLLRQPDDVREAVRLQRESIARSGIAARALRVGGELPSFTLADADGQAVASDQLVALGPVVVVFYRGAWDKFSRAWLASLEERLPELEAAGAQVIAISGESIERAERMQEKAGLTYTVLSDPGLLVSRRFGIVYRVPDGARDVMRQHGFDLSRDLGTEESELPLPAAYVIGRSGKVVYAKVPADPYQPADPAELMAAVARLAET